MSIKTYRITFYPETMSKPIEINATSYDFGTDFVRFEDNDTPLPAPKVLYRVKIKDVFSIETVVKQEVSKMGVQH